MASNNLLASTNDATLLAAQCKIYTSFYDSSYRNKANYLIDATILLID